VASAQPQLTKADRSAMHEAYALDLILNGNGY